MGVDQLKTPLHQNHTDRNARMVDFAGWSMPVQYEGIVAEHLATRSGVTLFDVSHMGRLSFSGSKAATFLDRISTRSVTTIPEGRIRYSLICREDGGILDDVLIYRMASESGESQYSMVVNASNRSKIVDWLGQQPDVCSLMDRTCETAMIAVQGPAALGVVARWLGWEPAEMPYYSGKNVHHPCGPITVSRTGYTGEDGVELIVEAGQASTVWETLMELGGEQQIRPAGLGARDTLRLEAAMPLYGHELGESIHAAQTGLDFAIQCKDRDFIGKQAILNAREKGGLPVRVGLELDGKRPAREGAEIYLENNKVGEVTSGTFSPTFSKPIAMAYVEGSAASLGTSLEVDIRGSRHAAVVVQLPFYQRT
jgi:aminomethyltransferase